MLISGNKPALLRSGRWGVHVPGSGKGVCGRLDDSRLHSLCSRKFPGDRTTRSFELADLAEAKMRDGVVEQVRADSHERSQDLFHPVSAERASMLSRLSGDELTRKLGLEPGSLVIVYDGHCVFCSAYIRLVRLRAAINSVHMLDAREVGRASLIKRETGLDVNIGMLAIYGDQVYSGADAIHFISLVSSASGIANRVVGRVFRSGRVAHALYPALRLGRNMTLRLLGRQPLQL